MNVSNDSIATPGSVLLGKYRVEYLLGIGGMGKVVAATHLQLQEKVAIKLLLPGVSENPDLVTRFLREGQAAARLRGEHSARVIDVGVLPDNTPYLVMEHLVGRDLGAAIAQGGLAMTEAVDYVLQACEGFAEAHSFGLVHRDVKPGNLFLTRRPDGSPLLKILDFGISKVPFATETSNVLTRTQMTMGTPSYMSPEQMRSARDVDARTDIWALGVVLYECLTGRRPFEADSFSGLVLEVATRPTPPLPATVSRGLATAIYRCLEKNPDDRFRSTAELASALAPFAGNQRAAATIVERTATLCGGRATPAMAPTIAASAQHTTLGSTAGEFRPQRPRSRGALLALLALGLVLVAGIAITSVLSQRADPRLGVSHPLDATVHAIDATADARMDAPVDAPIDALVPVDAAPFRAPSSAKPPRAPPFKRSVESPPRTTPPPSPPTPRVDENQIPTGRVHVDPHASEVKKP